MTIDVLPAKPLGDEGPTLYKLVGSDADGVKNILRTIAYGRDSRNEYMKYPGPSPVSIMRSDMPKLSKETYLAAEKTDGVRFGMMFAVYGSANICVAFDRKLEFFIAPIQRIPTALFQGTVLDGEMAWNTAVRRWEYLVFDAIYISGIPVFAKTFTDRLLTIGKALGPYEYTPAHDAFAMSVKEFVPLKRFGDVQRKMESSQYAADGLVMVPDAQPVVYGRHMGYFKWKTKHTIDFILGDRNQLLTYDSSAKKLVPFGKLAAKVPHATAKKGDVLECTLVDHSKKTFEIVIVRTDKTTANDVFTATKTVENSMENITLIDIALVVSPASGFFMPAGSSWAD
jgi:hypothetical protein